MVLEDVQNAIRNHQTEHHKHRFTEKVSVTTIKASRASLLVSNSIPCVFEHRRGRRARPMKAAVDVEISREFYLSYPVIKVCRVTTYYTLCAF